MLTTKEVSELLGVSNVTVLSYVERGLLKCRKLPGKRGRRQFKEEDVADFIKSLESGDGNEEE